MKITEKIAKEIDRIIRMDDLSVSIEQKKVLILGEIAVTLAGLLEVKLAEADFHKLRDTNVGDMMEGLYETNRR